NRGSLNVPGFIGNIDDYALKDDMISAQQVALIHGLGRLAGVTYGAGATLGADIDGVLSAYNTQGSATAGGSTWYYAPDVGGGTTIGTIGGTVAGGNAYVVLGSDGSGITLVPEPSSYALMIFAAGTIATVRSRRLRSRNRFPR